MKKEGLKADGTLKKGYRFAKGGAVVKAKSTTTNKKMTKSVTPNKKIKPVVSSKKKTTKTPVTAKKRKTLRNTTPTIPSGKGLTEESVWAMFMETNEAIKNLTIQMGGVGRSAGLIAENIFQETFKEDFNSKGFIIIDGICFNKMAINFEIYKGVQSKGEIDILLSNNKSALIIEIKYSRIAQQGILGELKNKEKNLREYDSELKNKPIKYGIAILGIRPKIKDFLLRKNIYVFTAKSGGVITYKPKN